MSATLLAPPAVAEDTAALADGPLRVHAFGGGVQSMALMWAWLQSGSCSWPQEMGHLGPFPLGQPSLVLFADTGAEPSYVYRIVELFQRFSRGQGIPFEIVSAGNLAYPKVSKNGTQGIFTPLFTKCIEAHWEQKKRKRFDDDALELLADDNAPQQSADAEHVWIKVGDEGQLLRQCTGRFKVEPMLARAREVAQGRKIELWLGISNEEAAARIKTSRFADVEYFYPLVFPQIRDEMFATIAPLSRNDCAQRLIELNIRPAKSACVFCPFRSEWSWRELRRNDPAAFAAACEYDDRMRYARPYYECYVHRSRTPLRDVVFAGSDERLLSLFAGADMSVTGGCDEGYCGL